MRLSRPRPRAVTVAGLVLALALALALAGCSGDEPVDRPVVAFLGGADSGSVRYEADVEALRDALRSDCEDCEYAALDAGGDADVQAEQMQQVLDGGADVVLLEAVDADEGAELVEQAGSVPVITLDRTVAGADYHVGYDPQASGRALARAAVDAADAAPDGPVRALLLGAEEGDAAGVETTARARRALENQGAEVLAEDTPTEAGEDEARSWTAEQIAARPVTDVDVVVTTTDGQAAGVVAAYDEADVPAGDRPAVVGTGADLASLQRLIAEEQAAALREPRDAVITRVVGTAAEVLEDAPVTDTTDVDGVPSFLGVPEPVTLRTLTTVMVGGGLVTTAELCEGDVAQDCARLGIS